MKKVLIATVSSTGNINAYYVTSLFNTQKLLNENNIECSIDIITNEPLLHLARNRALSIFVKSDCDDLIMIDSDQAWEPNDLLKLINSDKDFIGAPVILKTENRYNVSFYEHSNEDIMEVEYIGTGFLKLSRNVAIKLYDSNDKYLISDKEYDSMVFETKIINDNILSEDFVLCKKWSDLGGKVYIDTTINPYHIGNTILKGNFKEYLK